MDKELRQEGEELREKVEQLSERIPSFLEKLLSSKDIARVPPELYINLEALLEYFRTREELKDRLQKAKELVAKEERKTKEVIKDE